MSKDSETVCKQDIGGSDVSEDLHICGTCKSHFSNIDEFVIHKKQGCGANKTSEVPNSVDESTSSALPTASDKPIPVLSCPSPAVQPSSSTPSTREATHSPDILIVTDKSTNLSSSSNSYSSYSATKSRSNKRFKCIYEGCLYSSAYPKDLERHLRVHTGEKPFECTLCGKKFNRSDKYKVHERRHHLVIKPYECTECSYATDDRSSLKKHLRIHSDERPFRCQICPYASRNSSQLIVHLRTHTGDAPFQCQMCPNKFKINSDLKRHLRLHTGEKPYTCSFCDYKCAIKGNLKTHFRVNHSTENLKKCSHCDFSSPSRRAFRQHQKSHVKVTIFKCPFPQCEYSCKSRALLRNHSRTHSDERPFKCKHCPYTSRHPGNVRAHMKKRHPEKLTTKSRKVGNRKKDAPKDAVSDVPATDSVAVVEQSKVQAVSKESSTNGKSCEKRGGRSRPKKRKKDAPKDAVSDVPATDSVAAVEQSKVQAVSKESTESTNGKSCEKRGGRSRPKKRKKDEPKDAVSDVPATDSVDAVEQSKVQAVSKESTDSTNGKSCEQRGVRIRPKCVRSFKCHLCTSAFVRMDSLKSHLRQHQELPLASQSTSNSTSLPSGSNSSPPETSDDRDKIQAVSKGTSTKRNKRESRSGRIRPMCVRSFKCHHCTAAFVRVDSLKSHLRQHRELHMASKSTSTSTSLPSDSNSLPSKTSDDCEKETSDSVVTQPTEDVKIIAATVSLDPTPNSVQPSCSETTNDHQALEDDTCVLPLLTKQEGENVSDQVIEQALRQSGVLCLPSGSLDCGATQNVVDDDSTGTIEVGTEPAEGDNFFMTNDEGGNSQEVLNAITALGSSPDVDLETIETSLSPSVDLSDDKTVVMNATTATDNMEIPLSALTASGIGGEPAQMIYQLQPCFQLVPYPSPDTVQYVLKTTPSGCTQILFNSATSETGESLELHDVGILLPHVDPPSPSPSSSASTSPSPSSPSSSQGTDNSFNQHLMNYMGDTFRNYWLVSTPLQQAIGELKVTAPAPSPPPPPSPEL